MRAYNIFLLLFLSLYAKWTYYLPSGVWILHGKQSNVTYACIHNNYMHITIFHMYMCIIIYIASSSRWFVRHDFMSSYARCTWDRPYSISCSCPACLHTYIYIRADTLWYTCAHTVLISLCGCVCVNCFSHNIIAINFRRATSIMQLKFRYRVAAHDSGTACP